MKKKAMIFLISYLTAASCITACGILPSSDKKEETKSTKQKKDEKDAKEAKEREEDEYEDLSLILEDEKEISALIRRYKLEKDDLIYTGSDPDIELVFDEDRELVKLVIDSEGFSFSGVEVGERFNTDKLDKKLEDYVPDEDYSSERGAVYASTELNDDWYVFFRSKNGKKIDRIIAFLGTEEGLEELAEMAGYMEPLTQEEEMDQETAVGFSQGEGFSPPTTAPLPPDEQTPQVIIQTVPVPQTIYVPVPQPEVSMSGEYLIPDSDTRYLSDAEVNTMSQDFARYALNEIYARHGRRFNDAALQAYFDEKTWYYGYVDPRDFNEDWLSPLEKENVRKLNRRRDGHSLP